MENVELIKALVAFQAELKPAAKSGLNPHFKSKFSTLEDVWEAVRGLLSKNGLALNQSTGHEPDASGGWVIITTLRHVGGGSLESITPLLGATTSQSMGSSISYSKRYAIMALLGVPSEDDDGHASTVQGTKSAAPKATASKSAPISADEALLTKRYFTESNSNAPVSPGKWSPTAPQIARLYAIAKSKNWNQDMLKEYLGAEYGITSSKELDIKQYEKTCAYLESL